MVINELPVGGIVRLGRYNMSHLNYNIEINWIKVSDDNHFITERVLLGTKFDEFESNWENNNDYWLSNIRQFINSDEANWYLPTHQYDKPVDYIYLNGGHSIRMSRYKGLLYYFEDKELSAFERFESGDFLRLPTSAEMLGGFRYFKKKSVRAYPVDEYGYLERKNYREGMYASYFVMDQRADGMVTEISRLGRFQSFMPCNYSGVRPVCKLKGHYELTPFIDNTYKMNLSSATPVKYFEETRSLDWLLGL